MKEKREKLCFVLPEYAHATHFSYVAEFVEALADEFDIFLITEKGTLPENSRVSRRHAGIMRFAPFRVGEMFSMLLWARMLGYRTQYVHYSFIGAIGSSLVTRVFGGRTLYWNCGMPWLFKRSAFQELYEHIAFRVIHFLVTGSDALVPGYSAFYNISHKKILVVPNWIDVGASAGLVSSVDRKALRSKLSIDSQAKVLLFVHRLAKRKGANLLPEILEQIENHEAVLLVIGDGPERESIVARMKEKGLSSRVRMLGAIPQAEVSQYFAIADLFLLPSEEEGFPHVLTEAMASGVPYVATDVGGVRDMTPDILHPYIVASGDESLFSQAVNELLRDEEKRRDVRKVMLSWVLRYDKPVVLRQFVEMLRSVA